MYTGATYTAKTGRMTINRYICTNPVNVVIGLVLVCTIIVSECIFAGIISCICFGIFLLHLLDKNPIIYLKYLHFFFCSAASITGCALIEYYDVELPELNDISAFQGALPLLVFSWWLFLSSLSIHDKQFNASSNMTKECRLINVKDELSRARGKVGLLLSLLVGTGLAVAAFSFLIVVRNPSFRIGVDRFRYAEVFNYGFVYTQAVRLSRYMTIPCMVAALYKKSKIGWAALAFYCLHSFWVGNKFGSFFSLLCIFGMIFSQRINDNLRNLRKLISLLLIATVVLIGIAVFVVSFTSEKNVSDYFFPRLAQQGQLWWKTYEKSDAMHISEISYEIDSIKNGSKDVSQNVGAQYGIYKIMYYTTPSDKVDQKISSGSRYTEAGFAAAYYYMGVLGCIIFAITGGILTSTFVNRFLYYLRYNQYLRAFIYLRFYTDLTVLMSMFIIFPYFNSTSILSYAILLLGRNKIYKFGNEQI